MLCRVWARAAPVQNIIECYTYQLVCVDAPNGIAPLLRLGAASVDAHVDDMGRGNILLKQLLHTLIAAAHDVGSVATIVVASALQATRAAGRGVEQGRLWTHVQCQRRQHVQYATRGLGDVPWGRQQCHGHACQSHVATQT